MAGNITLRKKAKLVLIFSLFGPPCIFKYYIFDMRDNLSLIWSFLLKVDSKPKFDSNVSMIKLNALTLLSNLNFVGIHSIDNSQKYRKLTFKNNILNKYSPYQPYEREYSGFFSEETGDAENCLFDTFSPSSL